MQRGVQEWSQPHLEVDVEGVEAGGVFWQLHANVGRADEDGLQALPLALHIRPGAEHHVHRPQLALPDGHLLKEGRIALGSA